MTGEPPWDRHLVGSPLITTVCFLSSIPYIFNFAALL